MGERDTSAEREAHIRQALAETEARDLDSADNAIADLLAMLDVSRGREHGPCDEIRLRHAIERAEALLAELDAVRAERDMWKREHDASTAEGVRAEVRAERAESGLAALRAAYAAHKVQRLAWRANDETSDAVSLAETWERVERAFADTAQAAEAYTRRVRAEALEAACEAYECDEDHDDTGGVCPSRWLRARAADERGGR